MPDSTKIQIAIAKLLLAFALAGLSLFCGAYSILAYYRLVSIAKGIEPYDLIRSRKVYRFIPVAGPIKKPFLINGKTRIRTQNQK